MNIIVPACGLSTRFPNRPLKWLLTDPTGNLMIQRALGGIKGKYRKMYLIVNSVICADYSLDTLTRIMSCYANVEIIVLDHQTGSQAETVYKALSMMLDIADEPIYIKDTDNYFEVELREGNYVSTYSLNDAETSHRGKSYVTATDGYIDKIVEKKVISDTFCCGGYGFEKASDYVEYYDFSMEYISDVIRDMISDRPYFETQPTKEYIDWGDLDSWERNR